MANQAAVISLAESAPAVTSIVPPSIYKGKLTPLIKSAAKPGSEKSNAAISSALVQSLKSGDQANIDWVLNQDVCFAFCTSRKLC